MQIKVVRASDELDSLAEEWNRLLESSASHVPFLHVVWDRPIVFYPESRWGAGSNANRQHRNL